MASLHEARALHRQGRLQEAEQAYRTLLQHSPHSDELMYWLGIVATQAGEHARAVQWFSQAIKRQRDNPTYHFAMGRALKARGEFERAVNCYERALVLDPALPDVHSSMGVALKLQGKLDAAALAYQRALQVSPQHPEALMNLANLLRERGDRAAAIAAYRAALLVAPENASGYANLGILLEETGQDADAATCFEHARRLDPYHFESNYRLGALLDRLGRSQDAVEAYARAAAARPDHAGVLYGAARALLKSGETRRALNAAEHAFRLEPAHSDLHFHVGLALLDEGETARAEASFRRALKVRPDNFEAYGNLAGALQLQDRFHEAIAAYGRAIEIAPQNALLWRNLASLNTLLGRLEIALHQYRKAVALDPSSRTIHSAYVLTLNYSLAMSQEELTAEHASYGRRARDGVVCNPAFANTADPERQLRIGLLSSDLREHSVAYFVESMFAHLDRAAFELHCLNATPKKDAYTARLRSRADGWHDLRPLAPLEGLRDLSRKAGVDILIDLGGHTSRWIEALNDRCAPLQITWLGYPTTTGAVAMDYRISDPAVDPEGSDELSTEKLIRLPHSYYCYSPYDTPDAASNAPATGNGFVTFGSFNNIVKISELNLTLWSRILAATPGAKLYVKGIGNKSRETREAFIERAAAAGIDPKRLIMAQWKNNRREHLEAYHGIDIALDSLPYNGATTTCEALWMGVPVVSMRGHTHAGRMGASILGAAGLPELIASTPEDYVARAVELAEDLPTLERYRHGLRGRLASSALMDGAGFMRAFEHVLREAWRRWCAGEPPCAITAPKQVERPQRTP